MCPAAMCYRSTDKKLTENSLNLYWLHVGSSMLTLVVLVEICLKLPLKNSPDNSPPHYLLQQNFCSQINKSVLNQFSF